MKILFVLEHSGISPLVPALRKLHDAGHSITLAARRVKSGHTARELQELADECERIEFTLLPCGRENDLSRAARDLRLGIDYLRYLEPGYRDTPKLRARAEANAPEWVHAAARRSPRLLSRLLRMAERTLPPPPYVEHYLRSEQPDVLLVTPLVDLGSRQADWLRGAKRLGIRTGFPVFSWDNLTNKGIVRDIPDLTLVWNDLQAREAAELHGIPRERIRITGAPVADPWFDWQPSRTRAEFCAEVGVDPQHPIVLYMCSSQFIAPHEYEFVPRWIERLRAEGGVLADAGYLIRPYPDTARRWAGSGVEGPQVRVWPRAGESPHDDRTKSNYFDSIYHSSAVVGINTTAQIESAIVGRPVHTVLTDEYRETQEGTLHFRYLEDDDFGLLHVGRNFEQHAQALAASVRGEPDDGRNERFVRRFVRPLGLDRSATDEVAAAIEELGSRPAPAPERPPAYAPLAHRALLRAASRSGDVAVGKEREERTPADELRRAIGRLAAGSKPVVAGPWPADEISELLYWIPVLRWAQTVHIGFRERLHVRHRPGHEAWYAGIGAPAEAPDGALELLPDLVLAARPELARQDPTRRIHHRLVEYLPLAIEVDDYEGTYGVGAYLALLAGKNAFVSGIDAADPDDLRVARTHLSRPPYGRFAATRQKKRKDIPWERLSEADEYTELMRMRLKHAVPVREPLVLISQVQRSGGTLLSQLFDGHREVHAHPHELYIGKPNKWDWPPLDLADPGSWFPTLYEPLVAEWVEKGYVKDDTARRKGGDPDVFPFVFSPKLQRMLFDAQIAQRPVERERDVLDAYFTSYFNAWLDNQNLSGPKRAVVAFAPRLAMELERVERYFSAYPDGLLVSVVRDPRGWYASARGHRKYYADLEEAIALWRASTEAAIEAAGRWPDRVALLTYEELLEDTEGAMSRLAARIGIAMTPELLVPTFNSRPIRANSSEAVERTGVIAERGSAFREALTADEIAQIERLAGDLYERATPVTLAT